MLETIEKGLVLFVEYGLPVFPYVAISLVIYYVMNLFVKPTIASHRDENGYHQSKLWRILRKCYPMYPMVMGLIAGLVLPHLSWGYCVVAGVCAQAWYFVLHATRSWLRKKGVDIPTPKLDSKSMLMPPGTDEELTKDTEE